MFKRIVNNVKLIAFAVVLGAVTGVVIWGFLKAVSYVTGLLWEKLPEAVQFPGYAIALCAVGGLIIGIVRKFFGDYPEELETVMTKVKKDGHYDYSKMLVMLIAAFLPLVFASSVGPEAGLTGVIVGLCYWVGDNVKYAKEHEKEYSEIGEAVTLGVLFHVPLFGIFAVEETEVELAKEEALGIRLPKPMKLVLYGSAVAGGLIAFYLLREFFGAAMEGFPSFDVASFTIPDFVAIILYLIIGIIMAYIFMGSEFIFEKISGVVPGIVKETLCGVALGAVITVVPMAAFSGEEQMGELTGTFKTFLPLVLIGIAVVKLILTSMCIKLGLKGGHFFPLIFACVCMGFGVGIFIFGYDLPHLVFAAGIVTAACLGAQMKKPIAVAVLCLLCFPVKMLFFLFLAAAIGSALGFKKKENDQEKKTDM